MNSGSLFQGLNSAFPKNPRKVNNPFEPSNSTSPILPIWSINNAICRVMFYSRTYTILRPPAQKKRKKGGGGEGTREKHRERVAAGKRLAEFNKQKKWPTLNGGSGAGGAAGRGRLVTSAPPSGMSLCITHTHTTITVTVTHSLYGCLGCFRVLV